MSRFVLFTTSPQGLVAKRFIDEYKKRQQTVDVITPDNLGEHTFAHTILLPRVAPHANNQAVAALKKIDKQGARIINSPEGWIISRDKARAAIALAHAGIPTPVTMPVDADTSFERCIHKVGRPFILKVIDGTHGEGVYIVDSPDQYNQLLHTGGPFIAQSFIAESGGADSRLIVIGDTVAVAMRRQAKAGEFRSNLHQGATAAPYQPTPLEIAIAIQATKAVALEVAGVDIIASKDGPLVLEVNPSPGLYIEKITGFNLAGAIVDYTLLVSTRA